MYLCFFYAFGKLITFIKKIFWCLLCLWKTVCNILLCFSCPSKTVCDILLGKKLVLYIVKIFFLHVVVYRDNFFQLHVTNKKKHANRKKKTKSLLLMFWHRKKTVIAAKKLQNKIETAVFFKLDLTSLFAKSQNREHCKIILQP